MANQRDIKRRIATVANTQKITKAMKLVAAAKFAKSVQRVVSSKPFSKGLKETASVVFSSLSSSEELPLAKSPPNAQRNLYVIFSTDRGLCGPLNSQLFKRMRPILAENLGKIDFVTVGRKAKSWLKIQLHTPLVSESTIAEGATHLFAIDLASQLSGFFESGQYKNIFLCYNEFESALVQIPTIEKWLPFDNLALAGKTSDKAADSNAGLIFLEPSAAELSRCLTETLLINKIQQAILQSTASEHGSRMTAMDSASRNASDVKKKLTLKYNRARQAAITKELIEIISGAEAL